MREKHALFLRDLKLDRPFCFLNLVIEGYDIFPLFFFFVSLFVFAFVFVS